MPIYLPVCDTHTAYLDKDSKKSRKRDHNDGDNVIDLLMKAKVISCPPHPSLLYIDVILLYIE